MPGLLPEGLPGYDKVAALLGKFAERLRRVEASQRTEVLPIYDADGKATTSSTDDPLYTVMGSQHSDSLVQVVAVGTLSDDTQTGTLRLVTADGSQIAATAVDSGRPVTLRSPRPQQGPFTLTGRTTGGTLTVAVVSATAPRWVEDDVG